MDCLFCKIIAGEIPSKKVYEDEFVYAFEDINKVADVHVLIVPKKHMANILEMEDSRIMMDVLEAVRVIVKENNLEENGFRLVINTGVDGGQTVNHLHFHLIGGRAMGWPPG